MIEFSRREEFAILSLARPQVLNALNKSMLDELDRSLDAVEQSEARCLILTGVGEKAFCAGADVAEMAAEGHVASFERTLRGQRIFSRLETLRQPSIALVDGYALGGGCELALAATFRLATSAARFGLPEVKLGLVPGYGGTQRLSRLVGTSLALEIIMSGRFVDAEEALRLGLISRLLSADDAPLDQAITYGRLFTGWSLATQRLIRHAVLGAAGLSLAEGLNLEACLSALSFASQDGKEGLAAFLTKRPPRFLDC